MKEKIKRDSGFTLVELVIAMAILAFIMTAVGTVMSSSMLHNRKANADITVQTSAQQTYNQLSDSVMQATDIILLGYTAPADLDFSVDEATVGAVNGLTYYVRDKAARDAFIAGTSAYNLRAGDPVPTTANVKYFTDLNPDDKIYVVRLYVDTAVELNISQCTAGIVGSYYNVEDNFASGWVQVKEEPNVDGTNMVWDTKDTLRNIYTFEDGNMYYERRYRLAYHANDVISSWGDSNAVRKCLYNAGFTLVYAGGDATSGTHVTGCVATVDAANGAIGFDLYFSDKNMTYTTLGMINTRNSFVLKGKKM